MILEVDGRRIIERGDVYYRGAHVASSSSSSPTRTPTSTRTETTKAAATDDNKAKAKAATPVGPPPGWSGKKDCGFLGLGCMLRRQDQTSSTSSPAERRFDEREEVAFSVEPYPSQAGVNLDANLTFAATTTVNDTQTQTPEVEVLTLTVTYTEMVMPNATSSITLSSSIIPSQQPIASAIGYDNEEGDDGGDLVGISGVQAQDEDDGSGVGFQGLFFRCASSSAHLHP